jgi:Tol biopolymer transport system component
MTRVVAACRQGKRRALFGLAAALLSGAAAVVALALGIGQAAGHTSARHADATGGGTQGSVDVHRASALTLAVSPDHQTLMMNFLGNLWTLPAAGGKATRVSDLLQDTAYPDWSPDGKTIAFQSYRSGTFHIWAMNPDGSDVRQLTDGGYDDREPMFSPDGTKIAFSSDRPPAGSAPGTKGGSYNVWVLTLASGQLSQVTHAAPAQSDYYPAWSADGSQITYVNTTHEIDSINADGSGTPQVLHSDAAGTFYSPTWSPDGKSLAYVELVNDPAPSTRLLVNGTVVSGTEDVFPFAARWTSSDSLIYAADGQIKQRNLTSGTVAEVPFTATVDFQRPSYPMKRHNFDSTAKQQARGIVSPQLSPSGKEVAFVALNQLW